MIGIRQWRLSRGRPDWDRSLYRSLVRWTLSSILRQAGLTTADLIELLG
ncbi:hypothetical protein [Pseudonocardia acidicola]|uniref:Uncharacterized protein n=1 Tax=Pseudonocardia acidicola TaxID=2724939 RepID=A0ABX1SJQ9_9PSEU|nr:hypothetical protein [Pseudonocardia acidicola]NMI01296.1 hypothetical protein [Pseudonocardia acidicola]